MGYQAGNNNQGCGAIALGASLMSKGNDVMSPGSGYGNRVFNYLSIYNDKSDNLVELVNSNLFKTSDVSLN